ncbi:MAG: hypothetical protein AAFX76_05060 [Planctomycetota bacterium]
MNKRTIGLVVVFVLIGIGYLFVFGNRGLPPVEAMALELPGQPLSFSFNDEVTVREVRVVQPASEPREGEVFVSSEDRVMWQLIPRDLREGEEAVPVPTTKLIRYGRGLRGMRRPPGVPRRGEPLEPGVDYVFKATLDEGLVELTFRITDKDPA